MIVSSFLLVLFAGNVRNLKFYTDVDLTLMAYQVQLGNRGSVSARRSRAESEIGQTSQSNPEN